MVMRSRILSDAYYFSPERKTAPPEYILYMCARALGIRTIRSVARDTPGDGNPVERRRYIFVLSSRSYIGFFNCVLDYDIPSQSIAVFPSFMYIIASCHRRAHSLPNGRPLDFPVPDSTRRRRQDSDCYTLKMKRLKTVLRQLH